MQLNWAFKNNITSLEVLYQFIGEGILAGIGGNRHFYALKCLFIFIPLPCLRNWIYGRWSV